MNDSPMKLLFDPHKDRENDEDFFVLRPSSSQSAMSPALPRLSASAIPACPRSVYLLDLPPVCGLFQEA